MSLILPGILSLLQHMTTLRNDPDAYRPEKCPCGYGKLWSHGHYLRKPYGCDSSDKQHIPVSILRYYCPHCCCTCSVLPECLPPRSWYLWKVRQIIFLCLLSGTSIRQTIARHCEIADSPHGTTVKRWWKGFKAGFSLYSFTLRNHLPSLGRQERFGDFWTEVLAKFSLASVMRLLHAEGICVP